MSWQILHDGGHKITQKSLEFFRGNIGKIGEVLRVCIDADREFNMEIVGKKGVMLLSGVPCGYWGEGPHGAVQILSTLEWPKFTREQWEEIVSKAGRIRIDIANKFMSWMFRHGINFHYEAITEVEEDAGA